jgi:hypothetical protein
MHLIVDAVKRRSKFLLVPAPRGVALALLAALALVAWPALLRGKPKPKPEPPPAAAPTHASLPADLNLASLRVSAMDTIYELDLSIEQIHALRANAVGTASTTARRAAKADPRLSAAFQDLASALLDGKDDQAIAKARSAVIEASGDEDPPLDDEIRVSPAARAKAAAVLAKIKASQMAAFLATHADEVGDPVEMMTDTLTVLRANRTKEGGGTNPDAAEEAAATIEEVSAKVSGLVGGIDEARTKEVDDQVSAWLKGNYELNEQAYASKQAAMEASAQKIVGDISSIGLLEHYLQNQVAILLSNPELSAALESIQASRL